MAEEFEVDLVGGDKPRGTMRIEKIKAGNLTREHIGKFAANNEDGFNYPIKIHDVVPKIDEPHGVIVTWTHSELPTRPAKTETIFLPFDLVVELVEGEMTGQ